MWICQSSTYVDDSIVVVVEWVCVYVRAGRLYFQEIIFFYGLLAPYMFLVSLIF
jgi:hypothetical protein